MIGHIKGIVETVDDETALIDVAGVGYEIYAAPRVLGQLVKGEETSLSIETIVREDMIRLYGFSSAHERRAFRLLQSVQGVGARHALSVLQVLPGEALYDAIASEDVTAISRANGVGKKIAQRIATELQSKLGQLAQGTAPAFAISAAAARTIIESTADGAIRDAISALVNLGYDTTQARTAVARAADGDAGGSVESLISSALKELAVA